jgi:hypothetical protein
MNEQRRSANTLRSDTVRRRGAGRQPIGPTDGPRPPRLATVLVIAAVLIGPIVALQVGRAFESGDLDAISLPLLGILWLLLAAIVFLAWGIMQRLRGEVVEGAEGAPTVLGARLTVLILVGAVALGIVVNQLTTATLR